MHFSEPFVPVAAGVLVIATLLGGAIGVMTASAPPSDADASSSLVAGLPALRDGTADFARYRYSVTTDGRVQLIDAAMSRSMEAFGRCGGELWSSGWLTLQNREAAALGLPPTDRAHRYHRSSGIFAQSNYRNDR
jgi:hypothetical protein